ncbi:hypothetical protein O181_082206 [Austropuccinia psidii MF-1]|uniref:Uncharacterized protein n=1 Tax=Austropuccinia psidii MF-1 TaxID=1389203 RepID=A0A9Q3FLN9_9BASI|nr:hypothetical protein [Austropuccinia psidii MF-1]
MTQQSTSNLPPSPPEETGEEQYAEESKEEDQSLQIERSRSEPTLPRNVRPEESPSSPTPGPRATSTPETQPRPQTNQMRASFSIPTNPSPLQHQILRQERPVVKIKAKDYNLNFKGEEVEKFLRKVERIAQIEGAR